VTPTDADPSDGDLLDRLPSSYAVALRLERAGASSDEIAEALGLPSDVMASHLVIAHAKMAALERGGDPSGFE